MISPSYASQWNRLAASLKIALKSSDSTPSRGGLGLTPMGSRKDGSVDAREPSSIAETVLELLVVTSVEVEEPVDTTDLWSLLRL
jgi:hypothetical protein